MDAASFNDQLGKSLYGEISKATVIDSCVMLEGSRDRHISRCWFKMQLMLPVTSKYDVTFKRCVFEELLIRSDSKINGVIKFENCTFKKSFVVKKAEVAKLRFVNCIIGQKTKDKRQTTASAWIFVSVKNQELARYPAIVTGRSWC